MKTIEARITKNIKEDPSIEACDIWNIEATFLDPLPSNATGLTVTLPAALPGEHAFAFKILGRGLL